MGDAAVRMRVGEVLFEVERETLLRVKDTYFYALLSSGAWQPGPDGVYSIDRPAMGFDRILEYLSSGELPVEELNDLEEECVYGNLNYFLIPHRRRWKYNTHSVIEGFRAKGICELKDGRLCGAFKNDVIVWSTDACVVELTLVGHARAVNQVVQLQDGRLCSYSRDMTLKLWSAESGACEATLSGHSDYVTCMAQLTDGRLCSSSLDQTIRVWNVSTGECDFAFGIPFANSLVELSDDRICIGNHNSGVISIYRVSTGECELAWEGHTLFGNGIVCIDATRICTGSYDCTIKVWNTVTGECERTLEGHRNALSSIVLLRDGRLCSAALDGVIKLWNLDTGECDKTLGRGGGCVRQLLQLGDGRLLSTRSASVLDHSSSAGVLLWS